MLASGNTIRTVLMAAAAAGSLAGAAQASDASREFGGSSGRMPLGGPAAAPAGFLEFCRRSPDQCREAGDREDAQSIQRRASQLYWAGVFSAPRAAAPAAMRSGRGEAVDWAAVFGINAANAARPATTRAAATAPSPHPTPLAPRRLVAAPPIPSAAETLEYRVAAVGERIAGLQAPRLATMGPSPVGGVYNPMSRAFAGLRAAKPELSPAPEAAPPAAAPLRDRLATERPLTEGLAKDRPIIERGPYAAPQTPVFKPAPPVVTPSMSSPAVVTLDGSGWAMVNAVNRTVNRRIRQTSDQRSFGVEDFWQAPTRDGARGDCEDYVLAKRQALIQVGIPVGALSIAIVKTSWGETHAVLLVATDGGEFVLDNLSSWISRWDRVGYVWQERQAPGKIFDWVQMAG